MRSYQFLLLSTIHKGTYFSTVSPTVYRQLEGYFPRCLSEMVSPAVSPLKSGIRQGPTIIQHCTVCSTFLMIWVTFGYLHLVKRYFVETCNIGANCIFLESLSTRQTIPSKMLWEIAAAFIRQIAQRWVSLSRQPKNKAEPRAMFASHPDLTRTARYQVPFLLRCPGTCFPFSPPSLVYMWVIRNLLPKGILRQCTSIWFQNKPGACGGKPAFAHVFNVIMRDDKLVFVEFFGLALSKPVLLAHFSVKNSSSQRGWSASQRTFGHVWRHFGSLQRRD